MVAIDRRIGLIFIGFLALLVAGGRRGRSYLGVDPGRLAAAGGGQPADHNDQCRPTRGTITDRNGVELALSESADDVIADPFLIKASTDGDRADSWRRCCTCRCLTVLTALTKPHTGFVHRWRSCVPATASAISKFTAQAAINGISLDPRGQARLSALVGGLPGARWRSTRTGAGTGGLEYRYNRCCAGKAGERRIVNDAIGQPISINDVAPDAGRARPSALTLDAALQDEVEQVLAGVGAQYSPKGATAIAMNPNTGAILALANWPRVNANDSRRRAGLRQA